MSESSDEDWGEDWIPYSERKEWADVTPLPQDDGENPVVCIAYSPKFREVYDYVRAVMTQREKSLRVLHLTKDALRLNPANYTVWQYRRDVLRELDCDLYEELEYINDVIHDNAKNYQVWHHRRVLVEMLNDPTKELELTEEVLDMDAKNYHAWQHRQWAIKTFNLYDDELRFVDRLISEDIRNNSAWNQRFFIVKHFGFTPEVIHREIQYTINRIRIVKNNESAWNYLCGVLKQGSDANSSIMEQYPVVLEFSEELYNGGIRSPYLLAFLSDLYKEQCLISSNSEEREQLSRKVYALCDELARKHDKVRRKYWQYIAEQLKVKLQNLEV